MSVTGKLIKMNKYLILITLSFIAIVGFIYFLVNSGRTAAPFAKYIHRSTVSIGGKNIFVDVADTENLREKGLSGRTGIKNDEGMIFIFNGAEIPGFWMKDMNFSIDIIWIGEDWKVVSVSEDLTPESYPEAYYPDTPVMYVMEVPAGFVKENNVYSGEDIRFNR